MKIEPKAFDSLLLALTESPEPPPTLEPNKICVKISKQLFTSKLTESSSLRDRDTEKHSLWRRISGQDFRLFNTSNLLMISLFQPVCLQFQELFSNLKSIFLASIPHVALCVITIIYNNWSDTIFTSSAGGSFNIYKYVKLTHNLCMLSWKCAIGSIGKHAECHHLNQRVSWASISELLLDFIVFQLFSVWTS